MHPTLAQQWGGYVPAGIFLILVLALAIFFTWLAVLGVIVFRNHNRPVAHSLVTWCVATLGLIYLVLLTACIIVSSITSGSDYVFLLGALACLPAASIEWRKAGWGAIYLAIVVLCIGFYHQIVFQPLSGYHATVIAIWSIIPLWVATLAIAASLFDWRGLKFNFQTLFAVIIGLALIVGSSGPIIFVAANS